MENINKSIKDIYSLSLNKEIHKAADRLTGIAKLEIIRNVAQQIMGSLTSDLLQINNYALIAVKLNGAVLKNNSDRIDFIGDHVRNTHAEQPFKILLSQAPQKILFDNEHNTFALEDDREWFEKTYMLIGVPIWMFIVKNDALQDKYNLHFTNEELMGIAAVSQHNAVNRQQPLLNMFCSLTIERQFEITRKLFAVIEDLCDSFKSNLFYFGSVQTLIHQDIGETDKLDVEDIGKTIKFELCILEKTPDCVSIFNWGYDPNLIADILKHNVKKEGMYARLTASRMQYSDIEKYLIMYNL